MTLSSPAAVPDAAANGAATPEFPPDDGLLGHVVRVTTLVEQVLEKVAGRHGISAGDYLVLGVVRHSPGHRSSPTAICEVLRRTTGGMSLTLDRLQAAGWLRRLPDPSDGRRVVVEATPAGLELAREVNAALHAWEAALPLAPERRRALGTALWELTEALTSVE